ncbi:hypothetical protein CVT26_003631 [Gymnopilus dilepis]|uniref:Uncharacterized protein n=1 Tax=Gymnopilus dilepis TaxID=231916 RepID=A0A409VR09_9AGAR|nr:hypothetical protein CVT26_003631 [Gymnopilus dilepis]
MVNAEALPVPDQKIAFLMVTALCSGMSIITCGFVIVTQGPSLKLTGDRERQRFLALVSLLAAIVGLVGNGLQLSDHPKSAGQSTASFFFNWFVQASYAFLMISFVASFHLVISLVLQELLTTLCCTFYLLTLPVMTPTFISLTNPSRSNVKVVARDLNITFVCIVEALATVSDVLLLLRFTSFRSNGHHTRRKMVQDMWIVYVFIWLSIGVDIFAKVFRNKTNDLISDLAITNLTLTLRALAALMYGSTLRNARELYEIHSGTFGSSLAQSSLTFTAAPGRKTGNPPRAYLSSSETATEFRVEPVTISTDIASQGVPVENRQAFDSKAQL